MVRLPRVASACICTVLLPLTAVAADVHDGLARARVLYNQRQFDAAIAAADEARTLPTDEDAADLIAARAFLERYRQSDAPDDLTGARDRLRRIDPHRLGSGERIEYAVGLGEQLYFEGSAGAAADIFDGLLAGRDQLGPDARERVLDWWASAVDAQARPRPDIDRQVMYQKVRDRMRDELGNNAASASASYWLAAAARGQGDLQAALAAAQAGWVRAPLAADRGAALRGDLDRHVDRAIIPERARALAQTPEALLADWMQFKSRWEK
jgi:hypothetical protein